MSVVIDASVALKWIFQEAGSAEAAALQNETLIAPQLWLIEAANVIWRHVVQKKISASEASAKLGDLSYAPVTGHAVEPLLPQALLLAMRLSHPVYDCIYLALAMREDAQLVTADRRFADACVKEKALSEYVRVLGAA